MAVFESTRRNIIPLVSLVVVAVGLTTAAVASIGCWLGERRRADESAPAQPMR